MFSTPLFYFEIVICLYVCILLSLSFWFQCWCQRGFNVFYRCFSSVCVAQMLALCEHDSCSWMNYVCSVQLNCYRVVSQSSWEQRQRNYMFKTLTYLILPEQCRFSLCTRFTQAITNYSRSHGCSQLVLCPHPLTLPSSARKTRPRSDDLCN